MAMHVRPRKKKGLSHEPARISMWTHFCRISLCAEPNFWLFFFFLVVRKKMTKIGREVTKKKKVGQKHYKKRIPAFRIAHFLKKKKNRTALSFFGKCSWDKLFFFFWALTVTVISMPYVSFNTHFILLFIYFLVAYVCFMCLHIFMDLSLHCHDIGLGLTG